MLQSRNYSLYAEIVSCVLFAVAAFNFDPELVTNDFSIACMFLAACAMVWAGIGYDYDRPSITDYIPVFTFVIGLAFVVCGSYIVRESIYGVLWLVEGILLIVSSVVFFHYARR